MNRFLHTIKLRVALLFLTVIGLASSTYGQTIVDYKSKVNAIHTQPSSVKAALLTERHNINLKSNKSFNSTSTWDGSESTDWNDPANWTPIGVPTATSSVVIAGTVIISGTSYTALAYSLTISNTGNLTVNPTNNLKITDFVDVKTGGSLIFENSSSLVQTNNVVNSGNITYKRLTTTNREYDYTYWSSPVATQNLLAVSPTTRIDKFHSFDAAANDWVIENPSTTTMVIGKGYIIRGIPSPGYHTASFVGVPNNGSLTTSVVGGETSNLIGNPYPSALDADYFLLHNAAVIDGTIYFWTHNTPITIRTQTPNPGTGYYAYSGNDYATYNLTGGVGTGTNNPIPSTTTQDDGPEPPPFYNPTDGPEPPPFNKPNSKIAAGQGFFTTSTMAGGTVTFNNSMRVDDSGNPLNNTNFYKTKNPKANTTTVEKNRIWLNLTNKEGAFKQTLVGYVTGATNSWDSLYDGESFDGNDFLDFYSINDNLNLTIQGRVLPFDENDEIPLGFRIAVGGTFEIGIDETDGVLANQPVFIEDKLTSTQFDLKSGRYTFSTTAGTFNNRFILRFKDKTLGNNELLAPLSQVVISMKNNQIKINSFAENIDKVTVYDLIGRQIYQKDKVSSNELVLSNFVSSHQTLIVKTTLQNGKTISDKIIY